MTEPAWLSIGADIATVISLGGTLWVALQTGKIKQLVVRNARVPDVMRALEKHSTSLRQALKDWPTREQEMTGTLSQIESVVVNILPKVQGAERKKLQVTSRLIKRRQAMWKGWAMQNVNIRQDKYWEIYDAVLGSIEALRQLHADYKKRF